jgi:hypothetical protein
VQLYFLPYQYFCLLGIKLLAIVPPAHRTPGAAIVEYRGQEVRLTTGYAKLQHSESPQK